MRYMLLNLQFLSSILMFNVLLSSATSNDECSKYKTLWYSYKYPYSDGLMKLSSTKTFTNVCEKSTCCDGTVQNEMVAVSKLRLQSIAEKHFQSISELLLNTSTTANNILVTNVESSKQQLNQMFLNTYNYNYKMHQTFFYDFYNKLKDYTDGKLDNLQKILDNFFADMAERIVGMMIIAKKDPDSIRCLTNNLMKLDPYQGADKAIASSILNSYPMARMFVNSQKAANDVFMDLIKDKTMPSWDCAMAFSKSFYCPLCSGSKAKPCDNLCKSTIDQCLGSLNNKEIAKLSKAWTKLVVAMEKLSNKLIHPFNMPEVNKNLHVKISDAIMNVHNFFPNVREKIWVNCNNNGASRDRRSADWTNPLLPSQTITDGQSSQNDVDLTKLVKTFSAKLPDIKMHLKKYKNIICSNSMIPIVDTSDQCWKGASDSSGVSNKSKQKKNNRNLQIDPIVTKSINKLNEIASMLNMMIDGKTKDPRAFKIEFIPVVKKPVSRQGDDTVPIVEGSGEKENMLPKKPVKSVETVLPNEQVTEGSGDGGNVPGGGSKTIKNETKVQPSFPKLPVIEQPVITKTPDIPKQKPVIPDDEDLGETSEDNKKNESPVIEGSGQVDNKPQLPVLPIITTTTPIPTPEVMRPRVPPTVGDPKEGSGFEESPDDETNKKPVIDNQPRFPVIIDDLSTESPSTTAPMPTVPKFIPPQELPGDIPQEIWIPRAMDYDIYGRLVSVTTKAGSSIRSIAAVALSLIAVIVTRVAMGQ